MQTETLIYIIFAGITALLLALFQYIYKSNRTKLNVLFAGLRFVSIFAVLLLLINPKFEKVTYVNVKPSLVVAVDNSESIQHLNQISNANQLINALKNNTPLNDKFDLDYYAFGDAFKKTDSFNFNASQTNLASVFKDLSQVYKNTVAPTILITDGNQTFGNDFIYASENFGQAVFPVILGDTITYSDVKIQQLNVNKYAFLKNKFPVEVIAVYNGNGSKKTQLRITSGNTIVYREDLTFSKTKNSHTISLTLPANKVGVNAYVATIVPLNNEKNIVNNSKPFAVDVIDQKTNVAIITTMSHPDLGSLKKAIESNEQRSVDIVDPNTFLKSLDDYQLAIIYQPNNAFKGVFDALDANGNNRFIITGTQTQWSFLNNIQNNYVQKGASLLEEYQASINNNYNTFIIEHLDFESFPPLQTEFEELTFNIPEDVILFKSVNRTVLEEPLLATFEFSNRREALLLGENIWKWRAQSYLQHKSFQQFDDFIGKLVQYLASNSKRTRLNLDYESFYNGNGEIKITAQFFNKNYEFDSKARLYITLKEVDTGEETSLPFVLKQNNYQIDLSHFTSGKYNFMVNVNSGEVTKTGRLQILDYNVEQQFLNANVTKLQQLATNTLGSSYFIENTTALINDLMGDSRFETVQKRSKNVVPLIDFKILLGLIVLSLSIEWFLRKYNGLI